VKTDHGKNEDRPDGNLVRRRKTSIEGRTVPNAVEGEWRLKQEAHQSSKLREGKQEI